MTARSPRLRRERMLTVTEGATVPKRILSREVLDRKAAHTRAVYATRKAAGYCAQGKCQQRAIPPSVCCPACLAARNEVTRKRKAKLRAERKASGMCLECGKNPASSYCPDCWPKKKRSPAYFAYLEQHASRSREEYAANKAVGVCVESGCRAPAKPGRVCCPACLAHQSELYKRSAKRAAWNRVGVCKRCGTPKLTRYCETCKPERK